MFRRALPFFAVAAVVAFNAAPASAQKQTLKMAYWAGPAHHMVKTQEAWIKTIEAASGGNLTVEVDKAPLAKPDGQYDLIKNGVRDLVWHVPAYTKGRFDMLAAGEIPFLCPNASVCSPALWKWYQKNGLAAKEFTDTKLLTVFVHGPGTIHTRKPAKTLEELKGVKLRAGGAGVPISQALGMSAISAPATEAHEMLSRGTIDGVLFPYEAVDSFRLTELVKALLEVPGGLYTATFVIVMNNNAFAKLTPANQAALTKASGEAGSRLFGEAWDAADARGKEGAKKRGNAILTVAPAELDRWRPMLKFVRDEWLKKAKDRGLDGEALLKDLEATIKASS
jgi:TRAP-type C4-dicarboxylate transport system substrate-binding protein